MAVDAMTWLHKAAFGCCVDLALGKPTQAYIRWCCRRAAMLSAHGVTPVFVLDGRPAACKRAVDEERRASRDKHRKRGLELHREGHAGRALKEFRQSIAISDEMLRTFFDVMVQKGFQVSFAPNEADSQCAFLAISGQVAGVISEDSDLLVFGAPLVVFKLDEEGWGLQVQYDDLSLAGLLPPTLFTHWRFVTMAVLAGCDYCPSLVGVGVKTACKIVSQAKDVDHVSVRWRDKQAVRLLWQGGYPLRDGYLAEVKHAVRCFFHAKVYDPRTRRTELLIRSLYDDSEKRKGNITDFEPWLCEIDTHSSDEENVVKACEGRINPRSRDAWRDEPLPPKRGRCLLDMGFQKQMVTPTPESPTRKRTVRTRLRNAVAQTPKRVRISLPVTPVVRSPVTAEPPTEHEKQFYTPQLAYDSENIAFEWPFDSFTYRSPSPPSAPCTLSTRPLLDSFYASPS